MPECEINENNRDIGYDQPWLRNAIPFTDGKIENCYRYAPINKTNSNADQCSSDMFDTSKKIPCTEFIYASNEKNVQTEVNISLKLIKIDTEFKKKNVTF